VKVPILGLNIKLMLVWQTEKEVATPMVQNDNNLGSPGERAIVYRKHSYISLDQVDPPPDRPPRLQRNGAPQKLYDSGLVQGVMGDGSKEVAGSCKGEDVGSSEVAGIDVMI
jgi:hypothetical protein